LPSCEDFWARFVTGDGVSGTGAIILIALGIMIASDFAHYLPTAAIAVNSQSPATERLPSSTGGWLQEES